MKYLLQLRKVFFYQNEEVFGSIEEGFGSIEEGFTLIEEAFASILRVANTAL